MPNRERKQCHGETTRGDRCSFNAQLGSDFCKIHERVVMREQQPETEAERITRGLTLAEKLEAAKQQMIGLADVAMRTVQEILESPTAKEADRLKAAQMVLDRAVAQRIEVEQASSDVRDLDAEIEDALAEVREELKTGTDG